MRYVQQFFVLMMLLLFPATALAHAVGVAFTLRDDKVDVEVFYDDDSPAPKAKVQVFHLAKNEVVDMGYTDDKGTWTFKAPPPGKYELRVDAGAGHRAKKAMHIPGAEPASDVETPSIAETRADQTATPWLRIGVGLALIAVSAAVVLRLVQSRAAKQSGESLPRA